MDVDTDGAKIDWNTRGDLLRYASALTPDPNDPAAVNMRATVLLMWVAKADCRDDVRCRMAALRRANNNRADIYASVADPPDDPEQLVEEAKTYYAFMRAT